MKLKSKDVIFFWSPMLSNVGTINAIIGMAKSLHKYSGYKIYILDILGEFRNFNNNNGFRNDDYFFRSDEHQLFELSAHILNEIGKRNPDPNANAMNFPLDNIIGFTIKLEIYKDENPV